MSFIKSLAFTGLSLVPAFAQAANQSTMPDQLDGLLSPQNYVFDTIANRQGKPIRKVVVNRTHKVLTGRISDSSATFKFECGQQFAKIQGEQNMVAVRYPETDMLTIRTGYGDFLMVAHPSGTPLLMQDMMPANTGTMRFEGLRKDNSVWSVRGGPTTKDLNTGFPDVNKMTLEPHPPETDAQTIQAADKLLTVACTTLGSVLDFSSRNIDTRLAAQETYARQQALQKALAVQGMEVDFKAEPFLPNKHKSSPTNKFAPTVR